MRAALIAFCAASGLVIGSFLNVVIYRVPRARSIVSPPSACPTCGVAISPRDNVPVFSWLLLRGRCRHCGAPISARYPLVELATGALFAASAARFGRSWDLLAYLAFFAGLLALALIDLELLLLPKAIVYTTLGFVSAFLVVTAASTPTWRSLWVALACALGWVALFAVVHLLSPRSLGFGDVRLAALLGLALGWLGVWYVVLGFIAANLLGVLVIGSMILFGKRERSAPLPYGVFLAAGATLIVFLGPAIVPSLQRV